MNDNRLCDIHVPKADILSAFQADEEIDGGVSVEGGERPDGVREAGVVVLLALFAVAGIGVGGREGGVRFAEIVEVVVDEAVIETMTTRMLAQHPRVAAAGAADWG